MLAFAAALLLALPLLLTLHALEEDPPIAHASHQLLRPTFCRERPVTDAPAIRRGARRRFLPISGSSA